MAGIDTIRLTLGCDEYGGGFSHVLALLNDCALRNGVNSDGTAYSYHTGKLDNLDIIVHVGSVSVTGSLPRWYLGDNLQTLTRGAVRDCIMKLSDTLHLPMEAASVGRLDIGANHITKDPPPMYFNYYRDLARHTRILCGAELVFRGGGSEFVFYDKIQEVRKHHGEIPDLYQGRNVLRTERRTTRINKKTAQARFGVFKVRGRTLYDESFYISAMKDYKATYDKIVRVTLDETERHIEMKTLTEFNMIGRLLCIHEFGGMEAFSMELDARQASGIITRQQKCKLLEGAREAMEYAGGITTVNSGVAELDALMKRDLAFFP